MILTGLQVIAVAGVLALAIVGLGASARVGARFRPAVVDIPPGLIVVLLGLGLPFVLVAFVLRAIRSRREPGGATESLRRWLMLLGLVLLVWFLRDLLSRSDLTANPAASTGRGPRPDLLPSWTSGVTGLVVILLAAAAGLLLWRGRTAARTTAAPRPEVAETPEVADAGRTPPPRRTGDLRDQLVDYYATMEAGLAAVGSPRRASETQHELLERASAAGLLPIGPATELTRLYLGARFSDHPVRSTDLATARSALTAVRVALRHPEDVDRSAPLDQQ